MRKNLKGMNPEDMPKGVSVTLGFDIRGKCYEFNHKTLGNNPFRD